MLSATTLTFTVSEVLVGLVFCVADMLFYKLDITHYVISNIDYKYYENKEI